MLGLAGEGEGGEGHLRGFKTVLHTLLCYDYILVQGLEEKKIDF